MLAFCGYDAVKGWPFGVKVTYGKAGETVGCNVTGLCMDCFNGDYSAGLYDYEEDYLKSMTNIQKKFLQERGKNNE